MKMRLNLAAIAAFVFAILVGCGGPDRAPVHPASGEIVQGGKPATGALVTLYPSASITDQSVKTLRPSGVVDGSGKYSLTSYVTNDGVPEGEWTVAVVWPDPKVDPKAREQIESQGDSVPDVLQGRFSTPEASPWKVTISPGENSLPKIDLSKP